MDIKLTDLILHVPGLLTAKECDTIINHYEQHADTAVTEKYQDSDTGNRAEGTFKCITLSAGTVAQQIAHDRTEEMIKRYLQYLETYNAFHADHKAGLRFSHAYRVLKYEVGSSITRHVDDHPFIYGSCTLNLNDEYEGGDFVFFKGQHRIKLGKGDALIFPADHFWVHEVDTITKGTRYSVNSFLQQVPQEVRNEVDRLLDVRNKMIMSNQISVDLSKMYNV